MILADQGAPGGIPLDVILEVNDHPQGSKVFPKELRIRQGMASCVRIRCGGIERAQAGLGKAQLTTQARPSLSLKTATRMTFSFLSGPSAR
jgi:hypothetical protein